LRIVDTRTLQVLRDVSTPNGQIEFAAWLTPRRVVGWEGRGSFAVDPVAGKLIGAHRFEAALLDAGAGRDTVVALLGAARGTRTCRLAVVGLSAQIRLVTLERAHCSAPIDEDGTVPEEARERRHAALAVDTAGNRAFVVAAGDPVAEIDLSTLRVTYHELAERTTAARTKWLFPGWERTASWLGDGRLAVGGVDYGEGYVDASGYLRQTRTPAGVRVVDTAAWTSRLLDARAEDFAVAGARLLTFGADGVRGFDPDGSPVFHALAGRAVYSVQVARGTAYAAPAGEPIALDTASGTVIRRVGGPIPQLLVGRLRAWR
jgi:hypothetical protein